jgi:hypothetical protein
VDYEGTVVHKFSSTARVREAGSAACDLGALDVVSFGGVDSAGEITAYGSD